MTKRAITTLPPLDVVAFLFPGKWFRWTPMVDFVFMFERTEDGVRLMGRRRGQSEWIEMPGFLNFKVIQNHNPQDFEFITPVEIEDDP